MKVSLVFLLIFAACLQLQAAETTNPDDIIQKEGELLIADGSSYYRFSKNGVFDSGPLGVSGRTIRGEWKQSGDYFLSSKASGAGRTASAIRATGAGSA